MIAGDSCGSAIGNPERTVRLVCLMTTLRDGLTICNLWCSNIFHQKVKCQIFLLKRICGSRVRVTRNKVRFCVHPPPERKTILIDRVGRAEAKIFDMRTWHDWPTFVYYSIILFILLSSIACKTRGDSTHVIVYGRHTGIVVKRITIKPHSGPYEL